MYCLTAGAVQGIRLVTVPTRRGRPDVQEPGWNSLSKLNCISACIAMQDAGGDEGLMLDPHGFVATCNSTNFFIVVCAAAARNAPFDPRTGGEEDLLEGTSGLLRGDAAEGVELWAPTSRHLMPGVTRDNVLAVAADLGLVVREKDFTLTDVYGALEAFVTGTAPGVRPVAQVLPCGVIMHATNFLATGKAWAICDRSHLLVRLHYQSAAMNFVVSTWGILCVCMKGEGIRDTLTAA